MIRSGFFSSLERDDDQVNNNNDDGDVNFSMFGFKVSATHPRLISSVTSRDRRSATSRDQRSSTSRDQRSSTSRDQRSSPTSLVRLRKLRWLVSKHTKNVKISLIPTSVPDPIVYNEYNNNNEETISQNYCNAIDHAYAEDNDDLVDSLPSPRSEKSINVQKNSDILSFQAANDNTNDADSSIKTTHDESKSEQPIIHDGLNDHPSALRYKINFKDKLALKKKLKWPRRGRWFESKYKPKRHVTTVKLTVPKAKFSRPFKKNIDPSYDYSSSEEKRSDQLANDNSNRESTKSESNETNVDPLCNYNTSEEERSDQLANDNSNKGSTRVESKKTTVDHLHYYNSSDQERSDHLANDNSNMESTRDEPSELLMLQKLIKQEVISEDDDDEIIEKQQQQQKTARANLSIDQMKEILQVDHCYGFIKKNYVADSPSRRVLLRENRFRSRFLRKEPVSVESLFLTDQSSNGVGGTQIETTNQNERNVFDVFIKPEPLDIDIKQEIDDTSTCESINRPRKPTINKCPCWRNLHKRSVERTKMNILHQYLSTVRDKFMCYMCLEVFSTPNLCFLHLCTKHFKIARFCQTCGQSYVMSKRRGKNLHRNECLARRRGCKEMRVMVTPIETIHEELKNELPIIDELENFRRAIRKTDGLVHRRNALRYNKRTFIEPVDDQKILDVSEYRSSDTSAINSNLKNVKVEMDHVSEICHVMTSLQEKLALESSHVMKRRLGRPPGSKNKPKCHVNVEVKRITTAESTTGDFKDPEIDHVITNQQRKRGTTTSSQQIEPLAGHRHVINAARPKLGRPFSKLYKTNGKNHVTKSTRVLTAYKRVRKIGCGHMTVKRRPIVLPPTLQKLQHQSTSHVIKKRRCILRPQEIVCENHVIKRKQGRPPTKKLCQEVSIRATEESHVTQDDTFVAPINAFSQQLISGDSNHMIKRKPGRPPKKMKSRLTYEHTYDPMIKDGSHVIKKEPIGENPRVTLADENNHVIKRRVGRPATKPNYEPIKGQPTKRHVTQSDCRVIRKYVRATGSCNSQVMKRKMGRFPIKLQKDIGQSHVISSATKTWRGNNAQSSTYEPFTCLFCLEKNSFASRYMLLDHVMTSHTAHVWSRSENACSICKWPVIDFSSLRYHLFLCHSSMFERPRYSHVVNRRNSLKTCINELKPPNSDGINVKDVLENHPDLLPPQKRRYKKRTDEPRDQQQSINLDENFEIFYDAAPVQPSENSQSQLDLQQQTIGAVGKPDDQSKANEKTCQSRDDLSESGISGVKITCSGDTATVVNKSGKYFCLFCLAPFEIRRLCVVHTMQCHLRSGFKQESSLAEAFETHLRALGCDNARKYCALCDKQFAYRVAYEKHLYRKHSCRPLAKCRHCGKLFADWATLFAHKSRCEIAAYVTV